MIAKQESYTFASRTCSSKNQSLQKSMLPPAQRKNKKSFLSLENKTLQTHNLSDTNRMICILNLRISIEKRKSQLVTKAKCHTGFSGNLTVSSSYQQRQFVFDD